MQRTAVLAPPTGRPLFTAVDTNQADEGLRRARAADAHRTRQQLREVADHFRTVNPDAPITDPARIATAVLVAGTVGRMRPLLRLMPFAGTLPAGTTRAAYADHIEGR